jgi:hypothetical protein
MEELMEREQAVEQLVVVREHENAFHVFLEEP